MPSGRRILSRIQSNSYNSSSKGGNGRYLIINIFPVQADIYSCATDISCAIIMIIMFIDKTVLKCYIETKPLCINEHDEVNKIK